MICYLDDDVDSNVLVRLAAQHAHQLISPRALGHSGDHDARHFLRAVSRGLPIITRNVDDFAALHAFALGIGGQHCGLILVYEEKDRKKNMKPNDIVTALTNLEGTQLPLINQLIVLNQYR